MSYAPPYLDMQFRPVEKVEGDRFKISPKERAALLTAKFKHKKELRERFGKDWKKHLNVPEKSIGTPMHINF